MATQRTLKLNLLADVDKFGKGLAKAGRDAQGFGGKVKAYGKIAAGAFVAVGAAAAAMAVKVGLTSVKAASDLSEEISKSNVIFGQSAKEIQAFAETADEALGLSKKQALGAASTFATLGKSAGLSGKDLTKFSKRSVTLATDLASFYNTDADEAITAIGAALRGESEPIRRFGVLLNDATLKAKAMEMGLYDGKGALDVQAKALASYEVILEQTTDAQGDFARTSDGLAGQQKILNAQLENLKTTMGEKLLPIMQNVVTQANFVAKAFAGKDPESLTERARELAGTYDGQGGSAYNLGLALSNAASAFGNLFTTLVSPNADGSANTLQTFANAINGLASALEKLATVYSKGAKVFRFLQNPFNLNIPEAGFTPRPQGKAAGGSVMGGRAYRVGEFGSEIFVPSGSGSIRKDRGGSNVVININGAVDANGTRRQLEQLFRTSSRQMGLVTLNGASL
jgi:hypothetical protein